MLAVPAAKEQWGAQPLLNKSCQLPASEPASRRPFSPFPVNECDRLGPPGSSGRDLTPSRCQYVARPLPSPGKWIWKTHQALGAALPEHFLREDPKWKWRILLDAATRSKAYWTRSCHNHLKLNGDCWLRNRMSTENLNNKKSHPQQAGLSLKIWKDKNWFFFLKICLNVCFIMSARP